jgi:bis(5'-nucleosyl)-tetraphosphatase (symmetrical)
MSVYAIGDIQGCYDELMTLLDHIDFNEQHDQLWFVGDLVNRGPKNLQTVRFIKSLGEKAVVVLGNHDLHLLAMKAGYRTPKKTDTFQDILDAEDADELLKWLRYRPMIHHDKTLGYTLLHAGLAPQWNLDLALSCAKELETVLRGPDHNNFFKEMYGNEPAAWSDTLAGYERLRFIVNCLTRMRFCDENGRIDMKQTGPPGSQRAPYLPWFSIPKRRSRDMKIICGHWSTLSYYAANGVFALDTGCVWGSGLTALKLDTIPKRITIPCSDR